MTELHGRLFDSRNLAKKEETIDVDSLGMCQLHNASVKPFPFSRINVSPRIGDSTRFLTLPHNGLFETVDNDLVDQLVGEFGSDKPPPVHRYRMSLYLALLVTVLMSTWLFIRFGIPAVTYHAAMMVPEQTLESIGDDAIVNLDETFLSPSNLTETRQEELTALFRGFVPDAENALSYELHFRDHDLEVANAFAAPSGDIVITDQLVNLSESNDELAAILLHEIAHVEYRHAIQSVIRTSALIVGIVAITGDVTSLNAVLLGVPALLLDYNYSRRMEWEADSYSLERMQQHNINPMAFVSIIKKAIQYREELLRKENESVDDEQENMDPVGDSQGYLSTHPRSKDRIDRFKEAAQQFGKPN